MRRVGFPKWTPLDLVDWLGKAEGKLPEQQASLFDRLTHDDRMRDVWDWHSRIESDALRFEKSTVGFCLSVNRAMQMPGRPGNLPPKQRALYLTKVRSHTEALIELLSQTRYDCWWDEGQEVLPSDTNLEEKIGSNIGSALSFAESEDEDLLIAYSVTRGGVMELPWDYPWAHLTELLRDVAEWAKQDDYWDRGFQSSQPIRQSGDRAHANYFNCTLFEEFFRRSGLPIPFSILTTLVNVALELPVEEEMNEDTVQKQVRRYLDRMTLAAGQEAPNH